MSLIQQLKSLEQADQVSESGINIEGYRDYRGVKVIGT